MKTWPLIIGIIVIIAILCSPGLAISKSELIAYYRTTPESPAYPDNNPNPAEDTGPFCSQSCFCKRPSDGAIAPCMCGAVDTSIYYQVITTCYTPTPTPTPTPQIPSWFGVKPDNSFSTKNDFFNASRFDVSAKVFGSLPRNGISSYATDLPSKGKPNIYLYSDRDLTARVRIAPENAITVSEPVYQPGKGWRAEIRNGSLNGTGDFLFYEARGSDFEWQKKEGYVIRAAYREQDMAFMLGQYGFNEKETVEFIDYWASHLIEDVDFVFYPQETEAVNQDMPLYISPEPDHVSRLWFYAEPLVSAPEPVTHPEKIVREGFYVVEWGVIIQNEWKILPTD